MPSASDATPLQFDGYHGCSEAHVEGILKTNFSVSECDDSWFSAGVYFYGDGINEDLGPGDFARIWAEKRAKIPGSSALKYTHYAVLKAKITAFRPFDATTDEGKKRINRTRYLLRKEIIENELPIKKRGHEDNAIINFMIESLKFDVLIHDCYDRTPVEHEYNFRTRFPTVRMIVVYEPQSCIDTSSIVVVKSGTISLSP
jgi:hypothetical protein